MNTSAKSALRLYIDMPLVEGATMDLPPAQAHYVGNVMRREIGDPLHIFNGKDGEWAADISEINKKRGRFVLQKQIRPQKAEPDIQLYFAPVKRAPLDLIAQKATELGATALCPVQTSRTIVTRVKEDRLLANGIEAAEQCERLSVPRILPLIKLDKLLASWEDSRRLIFCDEEGDALPLLEALPPFKEKAGKWAILIGPEGGFTPEERAQLRAQAFVLPVSLGPRILRADTAAFAALTLWQAALGDFND